MTTRRYKANILTPPDSVQEQSAEWKAQHAPVVMEPQQEPIFVKLIEALGEQRPLTGKKYQLTMRTFVKRDRIPWLSKSDVIYVYDQLCAKGVMELDPELRIHLQKKPTRSQAGVTVVTVLTKPYPCPAECIFCPTDVRMPKSYLHDEPGAQRAERHGFDPYQQTAGRISALEQIGHPVDKIELLVLGGTWSSYTRSYQEWFIQRCFDGINGEDSDSLADAQAKNAVGARRNVGLVVETRQDHIDVDELRWMRTLGVTKVQVGIQSSDDRILALNKRGNDSQCTRDAFRLLRLGGFKIHGHWMANLLGATVEGDVEDYGRLWSDPALRPDELKIYPTMLVQNAELYQYWQRGEYKPYTEAEVTDVLIRCMVQTPRYVRLTRVIRDFPTTNIVEGNKKANLRQIATLKLEKEGLKLEDIRYREIRRDKVTLDDLSLRIETYETDATTEHFLSYETEAHSENGNRLAGFLRLSFPNQDATHPLPELTNHAMIREVHVYGPALNLGDSSKGEAQHMGLGSRLMAKAKEMAIAAGYSHIAVISAVGTREYYAKHHGFKMDGMYMTAVL